MLLSRIKRRHKEYPEPSGSRLLAALYTRTKPYYAYDVLGRPYSRDTEYPQKEEQHSAAFSYNPRSELTSAQVSDKLYGYDYDNIGKTANGCKTDWTNASRHEPEGRGAVRRLQVNYRYYNPTDGRWTRRDPIGIEGGTNLYVYVKAKPTFIYDYLGMDADGGFAFDWGIETVFFLDQAGGRNHPRVVSGLTGEDLLEHLENITSESCCVRNFRIAGHGWARGKGDGVPSPDKGNERGFLQDKYVPNQEAGIADISDLEQKN